MNLDEESPRDLQSRIAGSRLASLKVFEYLEARQIEHSSRISGATLAAVCGVDSRTWRKWAGDERAMPLSARRLLQLIAFYN